MSNATDAATAFTFTTAAAYAEIAALHRGWPRTTQVAVDTEIIAMPLSLATKKRELTGPKLGKGANAEGIGRSKGGAPDAIGV